ncbi:MAG: RDD family protein [Planctomycetota bacterium]|jgi:uncharacterized RDD family membrane protein YckC
MDATGDVVIEAPHGYLSEEDKRKFTITAGILGAVFFVAQFVVPFLVMFVSMPVMFDTGEWMTQIDAGGAVFWNDAIWFTQKQLRDGQVTVSRITPDSEQEQVEVAKLPHDDVKLLAGENGLWVISSSTVERVLDGDFQQPQQTEQLGDFSKPFLCENQPGVVENTPAGIFVLTYDDGRWEKKLKLDLEYESAEFDVEEHLEAQAEKELVHLFLQHGQTLYYKTRPIDDAAAASGQWETVCEVAGPWQSVLNAGQPQVFCLQRSDPRTQIRGFARSSDGWDRFFSHPAGIVEDFGVCLPQGDDRFFLLTAGFPGSVRLVQIEGDAVVNTTRYGKGFFPFKGFGLLVFVPHLFPFILPLLLAVVLSGMMRKHRVCVHTSQSDALAYASLTRRALAQLVDALILAGPFIVGVILAMRVFFDFDQMASGFPIGFLAMPLLMCAGIPWAIIWLLVFSATEGSSGATPGKWLFGIRVLGSDLRPCGFGRAFIRNILKFVDGFFNFMVGVMVAALSENWQRVGDMAARTVVVNARDNYQASNVYELSNS